MSNRWIERLVGSTLRESCSPLMLGGRGGRGRESREEWKNDKRAEAEVGRNEMWMSGR